MIGRRLAGALVALVVAAPVVGAYVAPPERIHGAIAETNKADGRDQAVRLELTMQVGERASVARGELVSHPTGLARLELRGVGGLVERHLLQGNERSVTRNGMPVDDPRAFLLPFFLLQADRPETLRAALTSFGVLVDQVGLAECGDSDCLVIGDPARALPRPDPPEARGLDAYEAIRGGRGAGDAATGDAEVERPDALGTAGTGADAAGGAGPEGGTGPRDAPRPRLWVETETYEIRGFDDGTGVQVRLGPIASFEDLRVPVWITIEEPGRVPARFDVLDASQVTAPASAFSRDWLFAAAADEAAPEELPAP